MPEYGAQADAGMICHAGSAGRDIAGGDEVEQRLNDFSAAGFAALVTAINIGVGCGGGGGMVCHGRGAA